MIFYSKHGTFLCHKYGEGEAVVKQLALSYICKYLFGISVCLERIQYFLFLLTSACNTLIALFHDSNSFFFFLQFIGLSLQAKKKYDRSSIIQVNDIKPFKKLQRTHTNLLVLFAQSGRSEFICQNTVIEFPINFQCNVTPLLLAFV